MRSYNKVVLIGNLTRDPEITAFQSGASVANLGLAVNERHKDKDGNPVEDVSFIDVSCWGRVAEIVEQYARKGTPILVEGRLKQETWEKEGRNFSKVKVVADKIIFLGDKRDEEQAQGQEQSRGEYRERRDDGNRRYSGSGSGGYRGNQGSGYGSGYRGNGGGYQSRGNGSGGYDDRRYPETDEESIPF